MKADAKTEAEKRNLDDLLALALIAPDPDVVTIGTGAGNNS